jgi:hypothetical protein
MNMKTLRFTLAPAMLALTVMAAPCLASAQQPGENIQPRSAEGQTPTQTAYTQEQLLTSTVHQAWLLSGKNEANFFEMVEQLANLSAKNRGITLPDDAAAGRRMGDYIKRTARADTDQLLYAVVDKAVLMTSKTPVHVAGQKH